MARMGAGEVCALLHNAELVLAEVRDPVVRAARLAKAVLEGTARVDELRRLCLGVIALAGVVEPVEQAMCELLVYGSEGRDRRAVEAVEEMEEGVWPIGTA